MEPEKKSNGALMGLIIIIIILVIGGIYFWQKSMNETPLPENNEVTSATSDETAELEANVTSMDLESLDSEI